MSEPASSNALSFEVRVASLRQQIQGELADVLGVPPETLDPSERFNRYGVNSPRATALIARLSTLLGRSLSPTLLWEYPTIHALAAHLAGGAVEPENGEAGSSGRRRAELDEPVAIVGIACRFPGGASSVERFWELLRDGVDAISEVPKDRWDADAYFDEDPTAQGKMNTRWGGFLDQIDGFDPLFFGISPREACQMDPQQRLMLELSLEALDDAGIAPPSLRQSRTGVFFGLLFRDYELLHEGQLGVEGVNVYTSTGNAACILSNRVSYALDLQGPSMTVDTACSSSLVAVHVACQSLRNGECSMALVGGVNLMIAPGTTVGLAKIGALSPDGRSKAFDARANGYVRGEGGGILVLKRLSQARRDGDSIYCVIRGSAVNNDGGSNGLTAPSPKAQQAVLLDACRSAEVEPRFIQYVEAHGTGTPLGDPIEAAALSAVYSRGRPAERPLLVGSVKTNIGHLEAGAGVAGLIKVALSLQKGILPPSLHFERPNPLIDFEALRVQVVSELRPWPAAAEEPRRAGVSSFGYGGTNAHVIVEGLPRPKRLLLLSGESPSELEASVRRAADAIARDEGELARWARASVRAAHGAHRLAFVVESAAELEREAEEVLAHRYPAGVSHGVSVEPRDAVWVFSGQGSQWLGMGAGLMAEEPLFRAALERCDRAMRPYLGWSILDALSASAGRVELDRIDVMWPLLFAIHMALADLWRAFGLKPAAVMGHSIGEVSAACVAGVLTLEEGARVLCHQAELVQRASGQGAMVLVALSAEEAERRIRPYSGRIWRAISASPVSTVLTGERAPLAEILAQLGGEGVFARWVETAAAVHSPQIGYIAEELPPRIDGIQPRAARVPLVSTVTGGLVQGEELGVAHWSRQLMVPVLFAEGIRCLLDRGHDLFLEISPHPIVQRSIEECSTHGGADAVAVASLFRGEPEGSAMRAALGALFVRGVNLGADSAVEGALAGDADDADVANVQGAAGRVFLLPVSARVDPALREVARRMSEHLRQADDLPVSDIGHAASVLRAHYEHRAAVTGRTRDELADALEAVAEGRDHASATVGIASAGTPPKVVFLFGGHGAQWLGMGQKLFAADGVFREAIERCDAALRAVMGWSVVEELHADEARSRLDQVDVIQPLTFSIQVALVALWRSLGVHPDAVIGHSLGEVAAAHVAGALSLEDAARVIFGRSRAAKRAQGAMGLVELPSAEVEQIIEPFKDKVSIGAINGPSTTLVSGEPDAVEQVLALLSKRDVFCRPVKISYASHSPQMDPLRDDLLGALEGLAPRAPSVAMLSTVTVGWVEGAEMDPAYWFRNLREPVRFFPGVQQLLEEGYNVLLEVSPHPVLAPSLEQSVRFTGKQARVVTSLRRGQDDVAAILGNLGALYCQGLPVDFARLYPQGGRRVRLPAYPWQRERYWIEAAPEGIPARRALRAQRAGGHPLLGAPLVLSGSGTTRFWEVVLTTAQADLRYLADHKVQDAVVLPGTAYLEMALAAARVAFGEGSHTMEEVSFREAMILQDQGALIVQTALAEDQPGWASFRISSRPAEEEGASSTAWKLHVTGGIRLGKAAAPVAVDLNGIRERCREELSGEAHYESLAAHGLPYGPAFQGVQQVFRGKREALGRVDLKEPGDASPYQVHPALLDAALQMLVNAWVDSGVEASEGPIVPVALRTLRVYQIPGAEEVWSHVALGEAQDVSEGSVRLLDASGQVLVEATGVRLQDLGRLIQKGREEDDSRFLSLQWQMVDAPAAPAGSRKARRGRWLVVADEGGVAAQVRALLEERGEAVVCTVDAASAARSEPGQQVLDLASPQAFDALLSRAFGDGQPCLGVVHLPSLDITPANTIGATPARADEARGWGSVLFLVQSLSRQPWRDAPRLWLITRGAQAVGAQKAPVEIFQAPLWGLGRTIGYEHPDLRCSRVDLSSPGLAGEAGQLVEELLADTREEEIAFRPEGRYVARLVRQAPSKRAAEVVEPSGDRPFRLEIDEPGVLDRLTLRLLERRAPGAGEVEIRVEAAGLNFIDVMKVTGVYPGLPPGTVPLGLECAGRVVAVGEGVNDLEVGQDVVAFTSFSFASHVTTPAIYVTRRPASLRAEQAAAVPVVFTTAWFALYHLGRLQKGERILIHSAAGGTGLAAVQLALRVGAEVFATVGTPDKRAFLQQLGVKHVFDSHSLDFADDVMRATGGEGIDMVLNSLAGEAIEKSLSVLAPDGRFLELGKRDIYADRPLGLGFFRKRIAYFAIDLLNFAEQRPARFGELLREVMAAFAEGSLKPQPVQVLPVSRATDAFRTMMHGRHTGKIAMSMADPAVRIAVPNMERPRLRPDGAYLITGGLGGLGLSVARWMVAQGARHLVLVGRQGAGTPAQTEAIEAMQSAGAEVRVARADVSDRAQVAELVASIQAQPHPLRGIVHAAGLLEDALLVQQGWERFRKALAPKVWGAFYLHALTLDQPLDFFVFYSSVTSLIGSPGQGNYAAGNAFLDALAHHRHSLGLPALSINWGPFAEVGLAAAHGNRGDRLAQRGMSSLTVADGEKYLERLLDSNDPQAGVAPLNVRQWIEFYPALASSSLLATLAQNQKRARGGATAVRDALLAAPAEERLGVLERFLREQLGVVLRVDGANIDRLAPLKSLGADSLTGLELRNRLEAALGLKLSSTLVWTYPTLTALTGYIGDQLTLSSGEPSGASAKAAQAAGVADAPERREASARAAEGAPKAREQVTPKAREQAAPTAREQIAPKAREQAAPKAREQAAVEVVRARPLDKADAAPEPIAVIGMGCRFPGGANDPEAYWQMLLDGVDGVREIPEDRWGVDANWPKTAETRWAGLIDTVDGFDAQFFKIAPREAMSLDPQQRLLLEVAWEALEHAGQPVNELVGSKTGVFVGILSFDYRERVTAGGAQQLDAYATTGNLLSTAAGRISFVLGLQGPCLSVDTACSSSLVALHLACQSLRSGESNMALAGGVNLILSPVMMHLLAKTQTIAPDGRCKTFDARANGFVRGEGSGLVVLKRLSDAQRDGDRIWAVIRSSAVNQDGRSTGLTAPNMLSQQALVQQALETARVSPAQVGYIEAHGTGTSLGDPIEVEALTAVLGQPRPDGSVCVLGSVKTNIGHLEAAAGVAGFIKVVLSLHHKLIPQHLHFQTLNPRISLEGTPFVVAQQQMPWASRGPRIAGVSSFGLSGTNAHVLLEEAPPQPEAAPSEVAEDLRPALLPLSAHSPEALKALAASFRDDLGDEGPDAPSIGDMVYTASVRRSHHEHRLTVVGRSRADLAMGLDAFVQGLKAPGVSVGTSKTGARPKVAFIFSGQGSQWRGMGLTLLEREPAFREAFTACDAAIRKYADVSPLAELRADKEASSQDIMQPMLFTMGVALSALWRAYGVEPDAVVGHSLGEVAAAHVAGALSLDDAARIICRRSKLMQRVSGKGAMLMVELPSAEAAEFIKGYEDRVSIAVINGPRSTVLGGDPATLDELLAKLEQRKVFCRRVKMDVASHSPQMEPLCGELIEALSGLAPRAATVPIYSTVLGEVSDGANLDPRYWAANMRQPVQFWRAASQLIEAGHTLFVEISPHPILLPAVEPMLRESTQGGLTAPSMRREQPEQATMLESLGGLFTQGYSLDWQKLYPSRGRCVPLPTYPWQRERYWMEASTARAAAGHASGSRAVPTGGHPLLGGTFDLASQPGAHFWESELGTDSLPYLGDHRVQQVVVLPGTAYLEMALAAARELRGAAHVLEEVAFREPLILQEGKARKVQVALTEETSGALSFRVSSRELSQNGGPSPSWTLHATGRVRAGEAPETASGGESLDLVQARCGAELQGKEHYEVMSKLGLLYGPAFQGVQRLWQGAKEALGQVELPLAIAREVSLYGLHPAMLDACLQVLAAIPPEDAEGGSAGPVVPVSIKQFRVYRPFDGEVFSHARLVGGEGAWLEGEIVVRDRAGQVLAEMLGLRLQRLEGAERKADEKTQSPFLAIEWQPTEPLPNPDAPKQKPRGRWLVLSEGGSLGDQVQAQLEERGEAVVRVGLGASGATTAAGADPGRLTLASPEGFDDLLREVFADRAPCRGVVHLFGSETPCDDEERSVDALGAAHERRYASVLHLVQALSRTRWRIMPRLWLFTGGAQMVGAESEPVRVGQAPLWGLGRTIAVEHTELHCTRVDVSPAGSAEEATALVRELLSDGTEEEVAFRAGARYVGRLVRRPLEAQEEALVPAGDRAYRVTLDTPGTFEQLKLRAIARRAPGPGEVEIRVRAAGLNFRDVLVVLGVIPDEQEGDRSVGIPLGEEFVGTVAALGQGVEGLHVGQEVMALGHTAFSSFATTLAWGVIPLPPQMAPEAAVTIPIAHLTAYYALAHVARLAPGERVLIHAAAGGVGLAAIQWAQHVGAEVYATAGSEDKREYLRSLGVKHVSDSRSSRFVDDILAWTQGEGVDVVLNSLSGDFIAQSLDLLRERGRFLELGKRDYLANMQLGMRPFLKNLSFSLIDLLAMMSKYPEIVRGLFQELRTWMEKGALRPLPHRAFPASEVADAFRFMAQGRHIGKVVVSMEDPNARITVPAESESRFRADATYLLTGGLGGLGLTVAQWMVAQGAQHLVLVGRQGATTPAQLDAVKALEAAGAKVTVARADIADAAQLSQVLQEIEARLPPLRGVLHAAAVLDDGLLLQQTVERYQKVAAPKVAGAWNLHLLTQGKPLDFFVLYSSGASMLGSPGQGNYVAANAFLDALAHYRRARGLPALSINWGAFSEVGLAAAQENRGERISHKGIRSMTPDEGSAMLGRLIRGDAVQIGAALFDARQWVEFYPQMGSSSLLSQLVRESAADKRAGRGGSAVRDTLLAATPEEQKRLMEQFVRSQVAEVVRINPAKIDIETPLKGLGIDSLMGLELRNRLEAAFGLTLSATLIWTYPDVAKLAGYLRSELGIGAEVTEPSRQKIAAVEDERADVEAIAQMSAEEQDALLDEQLASLEDLLG